MYRNSVRAFGVLALLCFSITGLGQLTVKWKSRFKEPAFTGFAHFGVGTDAESNTTIVGISSINDQIKKVISRRDPSGKPLWTTTIGQYNNSYFKYFDFFVSASGSTYLASDSTFTKVDNWGEVQWQRPGCVSMSTDNNQYIFIQTLDKIIKYDTVGNSLYEIDSPGEGMYMTAGKLGKLFINYGEKVFGLDENGEKIWEQTLKMANGVSGLAGSIASNGNGLVYATAIGSYESGDEKRKKNELITYDGDYGDWLTLLFCFDENGNKLWETIVPYSFDFGNISNLRTNKQGNLAVFSNDEIYVYSSVGEILWHTTATNYLSSKNSLILDENNEVYTITPQEDNELHLLSKYDPNGIIRLEHEVDLAFPPTFTKSRDGDLCVLGLNKGKPLLFRFGIGPGFKPITFNLVDARSDKLIQPLKSGDEIILGEDKRITILARISDTVTSSVRMHLERTNWTVVRTQIENTAPYALFGNKGADFKGWKPKGGSYTLKAKAFANKKAGGSSGGNYEATFNLIIPEISFLHLIDANTDNFVLTLQDGAVYNRSQLPELVNITTTTAEEYAGSVRFRLNNWYTMENHAPFALAGNNGNDYKGFDLKPGVYTLSATPYSKDNGQGDKYKGLTINFTVVDDQIRRPALVKQVKSVPALYENKAGIHVFPNPIHDHATITFTPEVSGPIVVRLFNTEGKLVQQLFNTHAAKGQTLIIPIQKGNLAAGIYTLQCATGPYISSRKVVIAL